MINKFCKMPLWECSRTLVDVAMGRKEAEIVLTNAKLVNVCTKEIIENTDVAISCGRIAMVGDCKHCIGKTTKVYDLEGKYLAPAFMDGHMHIESSMLVPSEYAKAVIPHGTSGVFFDPHEICNVMGLYGVRCMLDDAKTTPLKAMLTTPSCVPAVPGFEDTGSHIGPEDIAETMKWDECVGLGEMMNFPGILSSNETTHAIVGETLKAGKAPTGHFSVPDTDKSLNAYIASGVNCCHESTREIDSLTKMRLGMYAMFREGSAWHDLKEVCKAITKHDIDTRFACMITDDSHPRTLVENGHLDHLLRRAVEEGIDPITAIQMITINVATCFGLQAEMGSVAPSKCADLTVLTDLKDFNVEKVFINGDLVAENGKPLFESGLYKFPEDVKHTMHINKITKDDFRIEAQGSKADVHVIEIVPAKTNTFDRLMTLPIVNGLIEADPSQDVMKAVVFERHHNTGKRGYGFIKGFGIKDGALAQTVAHDAHNLMVVGTNDEDMVLAANTLIECGGGAVAVKDGKILGIIKLPIAGLMSDKGLNDALAQVISLEEAWKELGCKHPSPFMTMGIIPLACLFETRLTDRGLVDCRTFQFLPLVEKTY